jgi:hypothetical protein
MTPEFVFTLMTPSALLTVLALVMALTAEVARQHRHAGSHFGSNPK